MNVTPANARLEALIERQIKLAEQQVIADNQKHKALIEKLDSIESYLAMIQSNTEK